MLQHLVSEGYLFPSSKSMYIFSNFYLLQYCTAKNVAAILDHVLCLWCVNCVVPESC